MTNETSTRTIKNRPFQNLMATLTITPLKQKKISTSPFQSHVALDWYWISFSVAFCRFMFTTSMVSTPETSIPTDSHKQKKGLIMLCTFIDNSRLASTESIRATFVMIYHIKVSNPISWIKNETPQHATMAKYSKNHHLLASELNGIEVCCNPLFSYLSFFSNLFFQLVLSAIAQGCFKRQWRVSECLRLNGLVLQLRRPSWQVTPRHLFFLQLLSKNLPSHGPKTVV